MKIIVVIICLIIGCRADSKIALSKIKVINFVMIDKLLTADTLVNEMNIRIAYYRDLISYKVPAIQFKEFGTETDAEGRIIKNFKPYDTTYSYYVIRKERSNGLRYDSITVKTPMVFSKDSLLKSINLDSTSLSFYEIDLGKPLTIVKQKNYRIEKFSKLLVNDPDSIYRYYDGNLNNVPFTFSKTLDENTGMKLWKTEFIYHRSKDKNNKPTPRIEAVTKIEEVYNVPKEFITIFKRFKEDISIIEKK